MQVAQEFLALMEVEVYAMLPDTTSSPRITETAEPQTTTTTAKSKVASVTTSQSTTRSSVTAVRTATKPEEVVPTTALISAENFERGTTTSVKPFINIETSVKTDTSSVSSSSGSASSSVSSSVFVAQTKNTDPTSLASETSGNVQVIKDTNDLPSTAIVPSLTTAEVSTRSINLPNNPSSNDDTLTNSTSTSSTNLSRQSSIIASASLNLGSTLFINFFATPSRNFIATIPAPTGDRLSAANHSELASLWVRTLDEKAKESSIGTTLKDTSLSIPMTSAAGQKDLTGYDKELVYTNEETNQTGSDDLDPFFHFCSPPSSLPLNTFVQLYSDRHGSAAIFSCLPGHVFNEGGTARTSICVDGQWTDIQGCHAITCAVDRNGFEEDHLLEGQVSMRTCHEQRLVFADGIREEKVKCVRKTRQSEDIKDNEDNGRLHKKTSNCSETNCYAAPLILNATMVMNPVLRSATFACWQEHRFSDGEHVKVIECNQDNSWDYNIGHCHKTSCEIPVMPAKVVLDAVIHENVVTVRCIPGFRFKDGDFAKFLLCNESGDWNNTLNSECKPVFCSDPPLVSNSTCSGGLESRLANGQFPYGATLICVCYDGLKFPDGKKQWTIVCGERGTWNATDASCDYGRCDPVSILAHGTTNSSGAEANSIVSYSCDAGYRFTNSLSSTVYCDGTRWTELLTNCTEITCPALELFNGETNYSANVQGTRVIVSCFHGYVIRGGHTSMTVSCTETGQWSSDATCTLVECGPVPVVMNSQVVSSGPMTYGTNVTITCLRGYWFTRDVVTTNMSCGADGNWTDIGYSRCIPVWCPPLVPRILSTTDTSINTVVNVSCPDGQWLTTRQMTAVSICGALGHWVPDVPDCVDRRYKTFSQLSVEASYSNAIGGLTAIVLVGLLLIFFVFDYKRWKSAIRTFRRNFSRTFL